MLDKDATDFLNGELLGDGSISVSIFRYASKHKEYIEWLSAILTSFGIEQGGKINCYSKSGKHRKQLINGHPFYKKDKIYTYYYYHSKCYINLKELYDKWCLHIFSFCPYCEIIFHDQTVNRREWQKYTSCPVCNEHKLKKKTIPKDIELTPITCRQWYIGDGHNNMLNGNGIRLFLHSFLPQDQLFLKQKLEELGFEIKVKDKDFIMNVKNTRKFLKYVGQCPVKCYKYKWLDLQDCPCKKYGYCPHGIKVKENLFIINEDTLKRFEEYRKVNDTIK